MAVAWCRRSTISAPDIPACRTRAGSTSTSSRSTSRSFAIVPATPTVWRWCLCSRRSAIGCRRWGVGVKTAEPATLRAGRGRDALRVDLIGDPMDTVAVADWLRDCRSPIVSAPGFPAQPKAHLPRVCALRSQSSRIGSCMPGIWQGMPNCSSRSCMACMPTS